MDEPGVKTLPLVYTPSVMPGMFRALVMLLALLAASPLTAPYAACDVLDLFGEGDTGSQTALKGPPTDAAPSLVARPMACAVVCGDCPAPRVAGSSVLSHEAQASRPLRL
jgi:hypothetical protein